MDHNGDERIDRFVWGIVGRKARQLMRRAEFASDERDDLKHRLLLRVLEQLPRHDPTRGHRYKFVTTVVERMAANMLRDRRTELRAKGRIVSLDVLTQQRHGRPVRLSETVGQETLDARIGTRPRSRVDLHQLGSDLKSVMRLLPSRQRRLVELLKTMSMSDAARRLGVPRSTLQDWRAKIRASFAKAGLADYS